MNLLKALLACCALVVLGTSTPAAAQAPAKDACKGLRIVRAPNGPGGPDSYARQVGGTLLIAADAKQESSYYFACGDGAYLRIDRSGTSHQVKGRYMRKAGAFVEEAEAMKAAPSPSPGAAAAPPAQVDTCEGLKVVAHKVGEQPTFSRAVGNDMVDADAQAAQPDGSTAYYFACGDSSFLRIDRAGKKGTVKGRFVKQGDNFVAK